MDIESIKQAIPELSYAEVEELESYCRDVLDAKETDGECNE